VAKAQAAKWKEIAKQYVPADVVDEAEFEEKMEALTLEKQGEEVQAAGQTGGRLRRCRDGWIGRHLRRLREPGSSWKGHRSSDWVGRHGTM
jgi:hypothetical protein